MGIKTCSKMISRFVCDICSQADEMGNDRNVFLKFVISQLFDIADSKSLKHLDLASAYTDDKIIQDFILTANAIYQAQKEKAENENGIGCIIGTRSDGKKFKILMGFMDEGEENDPWED